MSGGVEKVDTESTHWRHGWEDVGEIGGFDAVGVWEGALEAIRGGGWGRAPPLRELRGSEEDARGLWWHEKGGRNRRDLPHGPPGLMGGAGRSWGK